MMKCPRVLRSFCLFACFAAVAVVGCSSPGPGDGGEGAGGASPTTGHGGTTGIAGSGAGGSIANGNGGTGAPTGVAGMPGKGGTSGAAGAGHGGTTGAAGMSGGKGGTTGIAGSGNGGTTGAAGSTTGSGGAAEIDCDAPALSGGTKHSSSNDSGTAAGLTWTIWSNNSGGSITTYDMPAFSAAWNNSGDFLARLGLQWDQSKTFDQLGTISSQFAYKKSGSGGDYSYIGVYGWSVSPCVEFYIVDDSYNQMPVDPGNATNKGTVTIDGGDYILYQRATNGTECSGGGGWQQFYSVRKQGRSCGVISISEHFKAWAAAGMTLGKLAQAQILVEVGGGSGSIDFTTANVTVTQ
jgi:hypothetical protein